MRAPHLTYFVCAALQVLLSMYVSPFFVTGHFKCFSSAKFSHWRQFQTRMSHIAIYVVVLNILPSSFELNFLMLLVFFLGSWCVLFDKLKGTGANILYSFFAWTGWIHAKTYRDWHANVPYRCTTISFGKILVSNSVLTKPKQYVTRTWWPVQKHKAKWLLPNYDSCQNTSFTTQTW
jgi:hypothetical protein